MQVDRRQGGADDPLNYKGVDGPSLVTVPQTVRPDKKHGRLNVETRNCLRCVVGNSIQRVRILESEYLIGGSACACSNNSHIKERRWVRKIICMRVSYETAQ